MASRFRTEESKKKFEKELELQSEYKKIYRNLKRSVMGYVKKGISTAFFKLPEEPMNITEASIRQLKKKVAEWKYYTSQKLTKEERVLIPENITRAMSHNIKALSEMSRKKSKLSDLTEQAIRKNREDLDRKLAERNKDNPDYEAFLAEAPKRRVPDKTTNEAIQFINMAKKAYEEASDALAKGDTERNWWIVQQKAITSLEAFANAGVKEYASLFSFNITHKGKGKDLYTFMVDSFDVALYDSDQLDKDGRFTALMEALIIEPKKLTAEERRQLDNIKNDLGLT